MVDRTAPGARDPSDESVALEAFRKMRDAAAVFGDAEAVLLSNASFDGLFADSTAMAELLDFLAQDDKDRLFALGERNFSVSRATSIHGLFVTITDVSRQFSEQARAAAEARTDALTGLGNRLMLRERLSGLLERRRPDEAIAVLAIDLDRFKAVNDTLGHDTGDDLLRMVADRIGSALGRDDLAARFGGDEFCVVQTGLSQSQPQSAEELAKRLVDLLSRSYLLHGHLVNIGASVGVAFCPADGTDDGTVLKNADLALYRAKQEGRGRHRFFEPAMDEDVRSRRSLEIDLRRALALRQFTLVYQPQYNLRSERITGFEALLRWNCPNRGLVSPADFIPLAEETGLIVPIGEWVMRTACREAAGWAGDLRVAVNVSALQFGNDGLTSTVVSALAESGLAAGRLELEITESVLVGDHEAALRILLGVRELGVRVSMDDFGTGYSSLSYLRSFPFDKIKIDQSFVRGDAAGPSGNAIVRAIAALGHSLGMTTTAEGVETPEQLESILAGGCTDVQGYLISRPLQPERIADFLRQHTVPEITSSRRRADTLSRKEPR